MKQEPVSEAVSAAQDATFDLDELHLIQANTQEAAQVSSALWNYHSEHRINGIPVEDSARNLPIDTEEILTAAFELDRKPCAVLLSIDTDDTAGADRYNELLNRVYKGDVIIIEEDRQFDAARGRFVVWIHYDEVVYRLNKRFTYLREG